MTRCLALLWHGRGPDEAHVLRPLAGALLGAGHRVLVPDWDSTTDDGGAAALSVVLGGGPVAAVVGLAADVRPRSPVDGSVPLDRVPEAQPAVPVHLVPGTEDGVVPGTEDGVVPPDGAVAFAAAVRAVTDALPGSSRDR